MFSWQDVKTVAANACKARVDTVAYRSPVGICVWESSNDDKAPPVDKAFHSCPRSRRLIVHSPKARCLEQIQRPSETVTVERAIDFRDRLLSNQHDNSTSADRFEKSPSIARRV